MHVARIAVGCGVIQESCVKSLSTTGPWYRTLRGPLKANVSLVSAPNAILSCLSQGWSESPFGSNGSEDYQMKGGNLMLIATTWRSVDHLDPEPDFSKMHGWYFERH